jgi:uncharacterized protein YdbL (DUF1318 family)
MKIINALLLVFVVFGFNLSVWGLDLEEARTKKLVTELPDGFIKANDPSAKGLESEVNSKRKKAYEDIVKQSQDEAKKNGGKGALSIEEVGKRAAQKIRDKMK